MIKRVFLVNVVTAGVVLVIDSPSFACSCAVSTPEEAARQADVIFTGVAEWNRRDKTIIVSTGFSVDQVYKGSVDQPVVRHPTEGPACGTRFQEGAVYTVFAYLRSGELHTSLCSPTQEGGGDHRDFGLRPLGVGFPPPLVPPRPASNWAPIVAATILIILITALALMIARRRAPLESLDDSSAVGSTPRGLSLWLVRWHGLFLGTPGRQPRSERGVRSPPWSAYEVSGSHPPCGIGLRRCDRMR
jgi:hypothetical protein